MERKTSFNNPFRTDYTPNQNFNNPFRTSVNENMNPNVLYNQVKYWVEFWEYLLIHIKTNGGGKPLPNIQMQNPIQKQGPIASSSEDLDQLALEFASKTPTKKTNLLASGGGQSHEEHEDIYMSNPALMSRVSCPGSFGSQGNYGMKPCKNNPFAPKLL